MKSVFSISVICIIIVFGVLAVHYRKLSSPITELEKCTMTPAMQMYVAIEIFSKKYRVPKNYMFGIAYKETRFISPLDSTYDPERSNSGAVGPMQLKYATAKETLSDIKFSKKSLKTDVFLNVECSAKLLRKLHDKYHDWKLALGAYNCGYPTINSYAREIYKYRFDNGTRNALVDRN